METKDIIELLDLIKHYLGNPSVDSLHKIEDQWSNIYSALEEKVIDYGDNNGWY